MAPLSSSSLINIMSNDVQCSSSYSRTSLEVKPRLDLWFENSSVWSLPSSPHNKGVRFSPRRNETFEIIHVSEYSEEEKQICWYSSDEKASMRENRKTCLAFLERNQEIPENESFDGLETSRDSYFSMQRIRQAVHAVLAEQHDQRMFGMVDPDYLALRYTSYTGHSSCKQQALQQESSSSILDSSCFRLAAMA